MAHRPDGTGQPEKPLDHVEGLIDTAAEAAAESAAPGTALPRRSGRVWRSILRLGPPPPAFWLILASLGPGLVAANAGNDAGGIATYASVGAGFGYSMLWVFPLILISLGIVQEMAARMGAATGKGLADLIRENFSIHVTALVMLALLVSNGATVLSEFVGIAASIHLLLPAAAPAISVYVLVPLVALGLWLLVVKGSYESAEKVFLVMTLVFFAYPVSAIMAHPNWGAALKQTVAPSFHLSHGYLLMLVAVVGTTITPYMQVYVQSAVAEKGVTPRDYAPERIGVYAGSIFAMLTASFIVIATAATLFAHHHYQVNSAAEAARALAPLAGRYAEYLFGIGLLGASVLAAAVLPLATAYAIAEALGVEKGISAGFRDAPIFMGLFTGLIILGVIAALIPGLPVIQVLVALQDIDGLLLPVVLFSILRLVNNRQLMGDMVNGRFYNAIAWLTAVVVSVLGLIFLLETVLGWFGLNL